MGSGVAIIEPDAISGLVGWWDFSDATTLFTDAGTTPVASDGDAIYQANDKSGTDKHLAQATANLRPLYKVNIQNSLSVARFDPATNADSLPVASAITTIAQPHTLFVVAAKRGTTFTANGSIFNGGGGFSPLIMSLATTGVWSMYAGSTVSSAVTADTAWHQLDMLGSGASSSLRLDGTEIATGNAGTTATGTSLRMTAAGGNDDWDIGEVCLFNEAVSSADAAGLRAHLKSKWGTP
jgi:hypothetical protein